MFIKYPLHRDIGIVPFTDNSIIAEPLYESSLENIVENNAMHAARFRRGNDGRVRQICGPRINFVTGRPAANYMMRALDSRDGIDKLVYCPKRMESRGARSGLIKEKTEKSHVHIKCQEIILVSKLKGNQNGINLFRRTRKYKRQRRSLH